jgi:DNA-binding MarR family transcriptional regulator
MPELSPDAVKRLVLLSTQFSNAATEAAIELTGDRLIAGAEPLALLSVLDLEGPARPSALIGTTGMSSGGLSKLLDRLEEAGLVERRYGKVPGDNRAVVVTLTPRGRARVRAVAGELAARFPESSEIVSSVTRTITS